MSNKKQIPCRVCGKLFTPCAYCQSHADVFRWRNFACSIECATKYINEAVAYIENKEKNIKLEKNDKNIVETKDADMGNKPTKTKKRTVENQLED